MVGDPPAALPEIPAVGDVVGGKFVVESVLGVGGMGVVLSARHLQLGQRVALKFLRGEAARNGEAVARFLREARSAVALQSTHVARVMDVGVLDDGLPYMVMEHLTGVDLRELLRQRGPLPLVEAVDYVLQAMEAIAEAHSIGLVHRDLKPANVFLTAKPDGSPLVKVLDFGISKTTTTASQSNLTTSSAVMGSPMYMSPEQFRSSKNVDVRTDIWALGTILYELVSGRTPFEDETLTGLCAKIAADRPAMLRERRPDLAASFEAIVMSCIEKDVKNRPQTTGALAAALRPFASLESRHAIDRIVRIGVARSRASSPSVPDSSARSLSGSDAHASTGFADTVANWQTKGTTKRRRAATVFVAAGAGGVAACLVALFAIGRSREAPTRPPLSLGVSASPDIAAPQIAATPPLLAAAPPSSSAPDAQAAAPSAPPSAAGSSLTARTAPARRPSSRSPSAPAASVSPKADIFLDRK